MANNQDAEPDSTTQHHRSQNQQLIRSLNKIEQNRIEWKRMKENRISHAHGPKFCRLFDAPLKKADKK